MAVSGHEVNDDYTKRLKYLGVHLYVGIESYIPVDPFSRIRWDGMT